ncbi:HD domain-containing protein [Nakamurella multipartita]|uniref:Metal dependent phosphohydrolase n=1 Tax=Nakamurella multipartita (strain ATCC 700099 / DSM 44233 / CIP 104796 / JCM 9543 / NBRC 105858 / Y-104) TaxID=479431 RepID=C8XFZ9_NAKMY|nr:HD domain-containing protein [Nakamurella multipartita]ACV78110.1 metal dependent phosphohydrolase [Nakamurella multipartita DSM 44233]
MTPNDRELVSAARRLAKRLLRKPFLERWLHTQGVAHRAEEIAPVVPRGDRPLLVSAAWLHDIGYSPIIRRTGFHPLDGALYLRDKGWDPRLVALVAHHSGARFVPVERGFADQMAEFVFEDSPLSDALTYADQTVGPGGRRMTVPYRIAEAIARHGPDSPNARARVDRVPYLLAVADRVEQRLVKGD